MVLTVGLHGAAMPAAALALASADLEVRAEQGPRLGAFVGRELTGQRFMMRVNMDGTFELREVGGAGRVTGSNGDIPGRLTLLDPRNCVSGPSFPKSCCVTQSVPTELRLENLDGSCRMLGGQVLRLPPG